MTNSVFSISSCLWLLYWQLLTLVVIVWDGVHDLSNQGQTFHTVNPKSCLFPFVIVLVRFGMIWTSPTMPETRANR
jgi:hypothetical protein